MHADVLLQAKHGVPYDLERKSTFIRIQLKSEQTEKYKIRIINMV